MINFKKPISFAVSYLFFMGLVRALIYFLLPQNTLVGLLTSFLIPVTFAALFCIFLKVQLSVNFISLVSKYITAFYGFTMFVFPTIYTFSFKANLFGQFELSKQSIPFVIQAILNIGIGALFLVIIFSYIFCLLLAGSRLSKIITKNNQEI